MKSLQSDHRSSGEPGGQHLYQPVTGFQNLSRGVQEHREQPSQQPKEYTGGHEEGHDRTQYQARHDGQGIDASEHQEHQGKRCKLSANTGGKRSTQQAGKTTIESLHEHRRDRGNAEQAEVGELKSHASHRRRIKNNVDHDSECQRRRKRDSTPGGPCAGGDGKQKRRAHQTRPGPDQDQITHYHGSNRARGRHPTPEKPSDQTGEHGEYRKVHAGKRKQMHDPGPGEEQEPLRINGRRVSKQERTE